MRGAFAGAVYRGGWGMRSLRSGLLWLGLLTFPVPGHAMSPSRRGPPGFVAANDGMSCAGTLVQLGDTPDRVLHFCGAPASARHWELKWRGKVAILEMWRYEQYGSFSRMLRFENGVLVSLAAISPS